MDRGAPKAKRPPRNNDTSADTHARIQRAARELFAQHGYVGTSIRDITAAAGVNLSAVQYHFTTKELLYLWILQTIIGPIGARIEWCMRGDDIAPLVKIERAIRAIFEHIRANPDMPSFMIREMAAANGPSMPVLKTMERVFPAMTAVIMKGQQAGTIRAGDPRLYILSTFAQPVYLCLTRKATGIQIDDERIVEHAVAMVRSGLEQR